jgi:DNA-binding MarR family transcriptional regulator
VADLDDLVHERIRLGILGVLSEVEGASFTYLRDALAATDGNLSSHLEVLRQAGLVEVQKEFVGRRPRTWVRATPGGRSTFEAEMKALRSLVDRYLPGRP